MSAVDDFFIVSPPKTVVRGGPVITITFDDGSECTLIARSKNPEATARLADRFEAALKYCRDRRLPPVPPPEPIMPRAVAEEITEEVMRIASEKHCA